MRTDQGGYGYSAAGLNGSHAWLLPTVDSVLSGLRLAKGHRRLFELGCGNGAVAAHLTRHGYEVHGVDTSEEGIALAKRHHPEIDLQQRSVYEPLADDFGQFPVVLSLEVIEHLYFPRKLCQTAYDLLEPGGTLILSTPYHSYLKNLALAVSGKLDAHFTALMDHGHIKFFSPGTLGAVLEEAGFEQISFSRVGRIPPLAKSMIAVARKRG